MHLPSWATRMRPVGIPHGSAVPCKRPVSGATPSRPRGPRGSARAAGSAGAPDTRPAQRVREALRERRRARPGSKLVAAAQEAAHGASSSRRHGRDVPALQVRGERAADRRRACVRRADLAGDDRAGREVAEPLVVARDQDAHDRRHVGRRAAPRRAAAGCARRSRAGRTGAPVGHHHPQPERPLARRAPGRAHLERARRRRRTRRSSADAVGDQRPRSRRAAARSAAPARRDHDAPWIAKSISAALKREPSPARRSRSSTPSGVAIVRVSSYSTGGEPTDPRRLRRSRRSGARLGAAAGRAAREPAAGPSGSAPRACCELGALYRGAAADLAYARRRFPGDPVVARLEALLVARPRHRLRAGLAAREPVGVPLARLLAAARRAPGADRGRVRAAARARRGSARLWAPSRSGRRARARPRRAARRPPTRRRRAATSTPPRARRSPRRC